MVRDAPRGRRAVLATLAGSAVAASAGCSAARRYLSDDDGREDGPIAVETLEAPGSDAGTARVPAADRVTFVEFFATTCPTCAAQMDALGAAVRAIDAEVQFLSVTSEPVGYTVTREEVADWWAKHGGAWPVAVDDGTALSHRYDATSVPTAVVVRSDGTVTWSHSGRVDADAIVEAVREAVAEESS